MADASLVNLGLLNFLVGDMLTAFGPFVSVHLTVAGWDPGRIGAVLSAGSIAGLVAQVPGGFLVDSASAKRNVAGAAILTIVVALGLLAAAPGFWPVLAAEVMQGSAGSVLGLAIAAITLALSRQEVLGERLGLNARFGAIGAALGAGLLGLVGDSLGSAYVFMVAAGFGLAGLQALRGIRRADLLAAPRHTGHYGAPPPAARRGRPQRMRQLIRDRRLLALMGCVAAFHLGNAALLPLAAADLARRGDERASLFAALALIVPQLLVAAASPWVGRLAQRRGRRLILLAGFLAVPARALLFAIDGSPPMILAAQALDGVSGAVLGVLIPLVVADITHSGGRFNLALGLVGVAVGLGATASNAAAGGIADLIGLSGAFLVLAAASLGAAGLVWLTLPETAHLPSARPAPVLATR